MANLLAERKGDVTSLARDPLCLDAVNDYVHTGDRRTKMNIDHRLAAVKQAFGYLAVSLVVPFGEGKKPSPSGVETREQLAILTEKQCDEVQGYFFSKPVDEQSFEGFLRTITFPDVPGVGAGDERGCSA